MPRTLSLLYFLPCCYIQIFFCNFFFFDSAPNSPQLQLPPLPIISSKFPRHTAAVDVFYGKVVADGKLADFFKGVNMETLKEHQRWFLRMAFTAIPKSINVEEYMLEKHQRLFSEQGLDVTHFDLVAGHFVATLEQLNVPADMIKEAVDIVVPLRPIFEKGAAMAAAKGADEEKKEEA